MKRYFPIFLVTILVFTAIDANAQRWKLRRYEADFYLAGVAFHGDIGLAGRPLSNMFNGARPSIGITPRYKLKENLAVSLDLGYLVFAGEDEPGESHNRYYSFNSHSFQHFARLEYIIIGNRRGNSGGIYNRKGMVNNFNRIQVYAYGGLGGILSKSLVLDLGNGGDELANNPGYDPGLKYTMGFPFGGGLKIAIDPRWSIGMEFGYTFTISDKLDGYAPEASNYNDTYYLWSLRAVYRVRNDRSGRPLFNKYYR